MSARLTSQLDAVWNFADASGEVPADPKCAVVVCPDTHGHVQLITHIGGQSVDVSVNTDDLLKAIHDATGRGEG